MDPLHSQITLKFAKCRTYPSLATETRCLSSLTTQKIRRSSQWSVDILPHSWPHFLNCVFLSRHINRRSATATALALVVPAFLSLFSLRPTRVVTIHPSPSKLLGILTSIPRADSLSVVLFGSGGNHKVLMGASFISL